MRNSFGWWDTAVDFIAEFEWWQWLIFLGVVMLFFAVGWGAMIAARDEEKYLAEHHCIVKGKTGGDLEPVFGGKGGVVVTPEKTIYVCDGGEIVIQ